MKNLKLGGDFKPEHRDPVKEDRIWLAVLYLFAITGAITWTVGLIYIAAKVINKLVSIGIID